MAETAVGLFEDASIAEAVVDSLRAHGFPSNGIRVVAAPNGATTGLNTTSEFKTTFSRDQRTMGVPETASDVYLNGFDRGNVLVYATGTRQQAAEAVTIMDEFAAIEIEEMVGASAGSLRRDSRAPLTGTGELGTMNPEPKLPESQVTIGEHEHSYTTHASRAKKEGARVFSW